MTHFCAARAADDDVVKHSFHIGHASPLSLPPVWGTRAEGDKTQTKEPRPGGRGAKKDRRAPRRYSVTLGPHGPGALSPRRPPFRANPADSHRHGPCVFSVERIFSAPLHRALGRRVNAGDRVAMLSTVPGDARRTVWSRVARGQRCPRYLIPPVSGERRHRSARKGRAVRRDGVSSIGARRAFRL